MTDFCGKVVARAGDWWNSIGWVLFIAPIILPLLIRDNGQAETVCLAALILLAIWWIVDLCDQMIAWWMVFTGIIMLGIGFLPRGGVLYIATWIIYWFKIRE